MVIAVAIDENTDAIRGFADGITFPVLMDPDHLLTELYAISNVPTVVMIDEHDRIAHPNWSAFGSDMFREFTGIDSDRQHDRVRAWVRNDTTELTADEIRAAVGDLSPDEELARLHFRIANELRQRDDEAGAARNYAVAGELAPHDWTIRRAALPLQGLDPFGENFMKLYEEAQAAGRPYHGLTGY